MGSATAADVHQDGHGTTYDQYGRPSWCYKPGPPSMVDLSKLVEGPANGQQYWAQHCSSPGCRSWIWVQKSRDYMPPAQYAKGHGSRATWRLAHTTVPAGHQHKTKQTKETKDNENQGP